MNRFQGGFQIDRKPIGAGFPTYVIAEIGVNHNGDVKLAKQLIEIAAAAGAQAAKLQSFSADRLVAPSAQKAAYQLVGADRNESQHAMLKSLELNEAAHRDLFEYAKICNITLISTPFDEESADLLDSLGTPAFKISSGDLTHHRLLRHIAAKGKPMLVSTGMANIGEVHGAVQAIAKAGNPPVALLHCVSVYPADPADANLRAMATLEASFGLPVGWSDHTTNPIVSWAAVALGARILEKHITLDKNMPGPDHSASANPEDFAAYVAGVRTVEATLGNGIKTMCPAEGPIAAVARRSVVTLVPIAAGNTILAEQLGARRPGTGLSPDLLPMLIGRKALRDIPPGTVLKLDMLAS